MGLLSSITKPALDFALPPRCPLCGVTVDEDHRFCLPCWQRLDFISEPWCSACGLPFAFDRPADSLCTSCLSDPPSHDGVRAAVRYDDSSSLLAIRLKYGGRLGLAELIARQLERFLSEVQENALIVPVPLHRWRIWSRGFNQSALIGRALAQRSNLALSLDVLRRTKATPPLRAMTAKQRASAVRNAFALSKQAKNRLTGRTIILVDDVYTSGSTANACAKLLKQGGAETVLVFCWARVFSEAES